MSDSEHDASVLGKRTRNGEDSESVPPKAPGHEMEDDSDEDVGPMPMPAGAEGATKKKRKGNSSLTVSASVDNTTHLCNSSPSRETVSGTPAKC